MIVFIGLVTGLILAFCFVIFKDYFNDKIKTPEDIQNEDINVLAWIPQIKSFDDNESSKLIVLEKTDSPASEAFRAIKSRIQFSSIDEGSPKTILVTSPAEKEGKTLVASNLAVSYAKSGLKTLLIDCDLRRPKIHAIMNDKKKPGLVDYLFKKVVFDEILKESGTRNFNFITAGSYPFYPSELLESKTMKSFLNDMRAAYDIVILDSAPILAVIDSEILSKMVDGTLLVVSADKTKSVLMLDAIKLLKNRKAVFLGSVLNNFKYKNGYGNYYKYYYNYQSNGKDYKKHKGKHEVLN